MTTSLINTQIKPFNASAFKAGDFIEVSDKDLEGKWLTSLLSAQLN